MVFCDMMIWSGKASKINYAFLYSEFGIQAAYFESFEFQSSWWLLHQPLEPPNESNYPLATF